jgi:hypothetical protein
VICLCVQYCILLETEITFFNFHYKLRDSGPSRNLFIFLFPESEPHQNNATPYMNNYSYLSEQNTSALYSTACVMVYVRVFEMYIDHRQYFIFLIIKITGQNCIRSLKERRT